MPLNYSVNLPNGVTASFWRLNTVIVDQTSGQITAFLSLYISKAAFQSGLDPVLTKNLTFPCTNATLTAANQANNGNLNAAIYSLLKNIPDFQGATDI